MENIEKIRERHQKEIDALQRECRHKTSKWTSYMWAPGHMGPNVRICDFCGKILERETFLTDDL